MCMRAFEHLEKDKLAIAPSPDTVALDLIWVYRFLMNRRLLQDFGAPVMQPWSKDEGHEVMAWRVPNLKNKEEVLQCSFENDRRDREDIAQ